MPETSQVGHGFPQEERLGPASRDTEEEPGRGLIGESLRGEWGFRHGPVGWWGWGTAQRWGVGVLTLVQQKERSKTCLLGA